MFNDIFKRTKQYTIISKLKSYKKAKFILTSTFEKIEKPEPCRFASEYSKETEKFILGLGFTGNNIDITSLYTNKEYVYRSKTGKTLLVVNLPDSIEEYLREISEFLRNIYMLDKEKTNV